MARRHIQVEEQLAHLAGDFLAREKPPRALVTVTRAALDDEYRNVTVFLSVLPHSEEDNVLKFAKRARTDFREYLKKHSALHPIPTVDFEIDYGERNRQRVDDLTRNN